MRWINTALLLAMASGLAGLAIGHESRAVSPILLPAGKPAVADIHRFHDPAAISCKSCHPRAVVSRWASDRLVPQMAQCEGCHKEVKGVTALTPYAGECRTCHTAPQAGQSPTRGTYPRPNIRFSHKAHNELRRCKACHQVAASGKPRGGAGM